MDAVKRDERAVQDRAAKVYEETRYARPYSAAYHAWWTRWMIDLVEPRGAILDLGCGNGLLGQFLPKERYDVTGLDLSERMVSYARARLRRAEVGDAERLPFGEASFDVVFARSVLHHLAHPEACVAEIRRVLRPGGRAVFSDPVRTLVSGVPRRILYARSDHFSALHRNFAPRDLVALIAGGLTIVLTRRFGYVAYPLLGFPDLLDVYRLVPGKRAVTPLLIGLDRAIGAVPLVNRLAWGMVILARA